MFGLRTVKPCEASIISDLAIKSKAHWGYDKIFMDACVSELSHSASDISSEMNRYYLAEDNGKILGFYKLENLYKKTVLLEALFVDTDSIGMGVGRALFEHAKMIARQCGGEFMEAQSDPNAEYFYLAMGARTKGWRESGSIPGRYLPMIELKV